MSANKRLVLIIQQVDPHPQVIRERIIAPAKTWTGGRHGSGASPCVFIDARSTPVDWANESFAIAVSPEFRYCVRSQTGSWYAADNARLHEREPQKTIVVDHTYIDTHTPVVRDRLGKAGFWCWLIGFYLAFMPLYALGLMGMTRRLQQIADPSWQPLLLVAEAGAIVIFVGILCQIAQLYVSIRTRESRHDLTGDPWNGRSLEWATSSPPRPTISQCCPASRQSTPSGR